MDTRDVIFEEEQSFRQPWIWAVILPISALIVLLVGYLVYEQLIMGRPVGDRPIPNDALPYFAYFMLLIALLIPFLFYVIKLKVRLDSRNLYVSFPPFVRRTIPLQDIVRWEARTYSPIREFGGWGVRLSTRGMAYNVSGNEGVQLELANGKRILIGSQRASDLARAISQAKGEQPQPRV